MSLFTPTALRANFYALPGINFESIIVYWVGGVLCTDRNTTSWTHKITVFSKRTNIIAIWLSGVGDIITESFRVWADVSAEVSAGWVVLEVLDTCIGKAVWGTQMRNRVTPVVGSHALFNTFISLSKQGNQPCIRTGGNALHVPVVLELSSWTCAVAFTIRGVKVRFSRWADCYTLLVSRIIVQRPVNIT